MAAHKGLPWWLSSKESAYSAEDSGSIPGLGRSPGGGMATYSTMLPWRIPQTEEPGGLQSMGLQRVEHDWVTKHAQLLMLRRNGTSQGLESGRELLRKVRNFLSRIIKHSLVAQMVKNNQGPA